VRGAAARSLAKEGQEGGALVLFVITAVALSLTPVGANAYTQIPIFRSQGGVTEVADPQNPSNDVVKFTTTGTISASVTRDLRAKNLQIDDMTNMIATKYFFLDKSCNAGSPRFSVNIDTGGAILPATGSTVGNIHGYFGAGGFGGGCQTGKWVFQDFANLDPTIGAPSWDLTQFGGGFSNTWAQVVTFFQTTFPNHKVKACGVFDDSGTFDVASQGTVYFDDLQCHDRVLEDHQDVAPGTNVPF
jgi:hypothetical protein